MKTVYILVTCLILGLLATLCGCQNQDPKSYDYTLDEVKGKLNFYAVAVPDISEYTERCDTLTFKGLWEYARKTDIYDHEYEPGEWHRDVEPCHPDDSRSEISTEGILGALHAMVKRGDYDKIDDLWTYLDANDWIAGAGPKEYTRVYQLKSIIKEIMAKGRGLAQDQHKVLRFAAESEDGSIGYRGNVLADYIALHHIALGYLESWHVVAVETLAAEVPQSPLYQGLFGCYSDDNAYQTALNILGNEELFPSDRLPERSNEGLWDWSDSPQVATFALTVAVMEHCHE